ncbi:PAS domain S-box protein [Aliivibrio kagoshimensis]|uniref:PAS domain S-box protein n=1 Tax=Aliivibrio kagoshimensis TaxID=2910230 RepID=UPI003D14CA2F
MGLRVKTLSTIAIVEVVLLVLLIGASLFALQKYHQTKLAKHAEYTGNLLAAAACESLVKNNTTKLDKLLNTVIKDKDLIHVSITGINNVMVEQSRVHSHQINKENLYTIEVPINEGDEYFGNVKMTFEIGSIAHILQEVKSWGLALIVIKLLCITFLIYLLSTWLNRQLYSLKHGVNMISNMGPGHQIEVNDNSDINHIVLAFNQMSRHLAQSHQNLNDSIKDQKQIASLACKSTTLYKAILSSSLDGIITIDNRNKVIEFNNKAEEIFGWNQSELLGSSIIEKRLIPAYNSLFEKHSNQYVTNEKNYDFDQIFIWKARHKNGHLIPIEVVISPIQLGDDTLFTAFIRDIRPKLYAEQEMRLAAHAFDSIEAMFITDKEGFILRTNPAFTQVTGFSNEEVLRQKPSILASGQHDDSFYKEMWEVLLLTNQWQGEIINKRKNGELYPQHLCISAVKDEKNRVTHYVAHFVDISEQKKNEQQLKQASQNAELANQAKSRFLATMSHEIRSPLNAIIAMTDMLLESPLNNEQKELAQVASQGGHTLITLINNILDFSKIESDHLILQEDWFSLHQTAEAVVSLFSLQAQQKNISVNLVLDPHLNQSYFGDPLRVSQILINILSNAIKFTEQGGIEMFIRLNLTNGIEITISDTGIGISEEDQKMIFAEFIQADSNNNRRFSGSGLGLAISKRLIELMNGKITVNSKEGLGSTFNIWLPILPAAHSEHIVTDEQLSAIQDIAYFHSIDNEIFSSALKKQLSLLGISLHSIEEIDASSTTQSIIFIDNDSSGYRCEEFIDLPKETFKFINLLPIEKQSIYQTLKPKGYDGYLTTPIKLDSLMQLLTADRCHREQLSLYGQKREPRQIEPNTAPPCDQPSILLVEDSPTNQAVANALLKCISSNITIAENGKYAVEFAKQQKFDLILMDLAMPVMDGIEATKLIRSGAGLNHQTAIIAMTANAFTEDKKECLDSGMDDFLTKPLDKDLFRSSVNKWLNTTTTEATSQIVLEHTISRSQPILNEAVIEQLLKDIPKPILTDILDTFHEETLKRTTDIEALLNTKDWDGLETEFHTLKSSAGNVGLAALQDVAKKMEYECRDFRSMSVSFSHLSILISESLTALNQHKENI